MYEIGLIYKRDGYYFLAVDKEVLLSARGGRFTEYEPGVKFDVARRVSVAKLCDNWGCSTDQMDETIHSYLHPRLTQKPEDKKKDAGKLRKAS